MAELTYSVAEAAEALGVSKREVYNLVHRTDFPAFQMAGKWRIAKVLLAAWVEREARKGRPDITAEVFSPVEKETRSQF